LLPTQVFDERWAWVVAAAAPGGARDWPRDLRGGRGGQPLQRRGAPAAAAEGARCRAATPYQEGCNPVHL